MPFQAESTSMNLGGLTSLSGRYSRTSMGRQSTQPALRAMLGLLDVALGLPAMANVSEFPIVQLGHRDALGGSIELTGHRVKSLWPGP
jgi:hypothetical protein